MPRSCPGGGGWAQLELTGALQSHMFAVLCKRNIPFVSEANIIKTPGPGGKVCFLCSYLLFFPSAVYADYETKNESNWSKRLLLRDSQDWLVYNST